MTNLQWAAEDPTLKPTAPQTGGVLHAAQAGTHLDLMLALRKNIADAIDRGVAARDLAALSRRLIEIDQEIRALSAPKEDPVQDGLDEESDTWTNEKDSDL